LSFFSTFIHSFKPKGTRERRMAKKQGQKRSSAPEACQRETIGEIVTKRRTTTHKAKVKPSELPSARHRFQRGESNLRESDIKKDARAKVRSAAEDANSSLPEAYFAMRIEIKAESAWVTPVSRGLIIKARRDARRSSFKTSTLSSRRGPGFR